MPVLWGKSSGKKRFFCPECKKSFIRKRNAPTLKFADFKAFYNFVVGKQSIIGLAESLRSSRTTLWRRFNFLDFYEIYLETERNCPSAAISDWKRAIIALVSAFFQGIPHQRCLAHLIREGKRLLPAGSPNYFTLELRKIVEEIILIKDPSDYFAWQTKLGEWQRDYGSLLKTRSSNPNTEKAWYTHGNLRRAINLLTKDQDTLFKYLHYSFLPSRNNSLEGVNSQLKRKLGNHRGMKAVQQINFCF